MFVSSDEIEKLKVYLGNVQCLIDNINEDENISKCLDELANISRVLKAHRSIKTKENKVNKLSIDSKKYT